jgi:hypothetical protein
MFPKGCGNAHVGVDGVVDVRCKGIRNFSAQCMWAKLEIMTSVMKGVLSVSKLGGYGTTLSNQF